jgi:uncharacterized protein involved in type VI secretion and phage assembly
MSKEITTRLNIDDKEVAHFVSVTLVQKFHDHHTFEIVLHQDALLQGSHTMQSTMDYIGKFVVLGFGLDSDGDNTFRGLITEAGLRQGQGCWAQLVLKGYSPTYLLEGGEHLDSYSDMGLAAIVKELAQNLAQNDLNLVAKPAFKGDIAYTCQYRESNFGFMRRLAAEYGEWFYFDGQNLYFGRPKSPEPLELLYGEQVQELDFSLRLVPSKVSHYSYNEKEHQLNTSEGGKVSTNPYMKKALGTTDQLYRQTVVQPTLLPAEGQGELDSYSTQQKGLKAAGSVVLVAQGDDPRVKIGGLVKITLNEHHYSGQGSEEGEYLITSITHHIADTGSYHHSFEAIPSANDYVPAEAAKPMAETQVAEVTDNADPKGIGRVKVQMLWQAEKNKSSDWIRLLTPDAGSSDKVGTNRGQVFIPEVGDQVLLGFRYNDPNRPFVMGSVFHGKNGKGGGKDNNIKSIKTKSGHSIEFDDTSKGTSLTIKDPAGNTIFLDTSGKNITITAPETMTLKAKNMVFKVEENMTTDIGGDSKTTIEKEMSTSVGKDHKLTITGKHEISSKETKETVDGDKTATIDGKWKQNIASAKLISEKGDFFIHSAKVATLQGDSDAKVSKG